MTSPLEADLPDEVPSVLSAVTAWADSSAEGLDPVQQARVRVQHLIALLLLAIGPAYGALFWVYDLALPSLIMFLLTPAVIPALLLLTRKGRSEEGGRIISIVSVLVITNALLGRGGMDSNCAAWLLCSPILGFTMVGPRHGRNVSLASAMVFVAVWAIEFYGPPLPWQLPADLSAIMPVVDYPAIALLFGAVLSVQVSIWESLIKDMRSTNERAMVEIEERKRAEQLATQAVKARTTFLATMSHEIRTPLNGVLGLTQVLLGSDLDADQRQLAKTVQGSGRLLRALLDDVLDYSKIDSGQMEVEHIPLDLPALCHEVVQLWEEKAKEKDIQLLFTPEAHSPNWVRSDPTKLRQILGNLVSNAIKFTDTGSVSILLSTTEDRLILAVQDTGIGMAPEALNHIFDAFRQADGSTTRRYGGTGLGLAISKGLASRMEGQLHVESTPASGTRFTLNLPLVLAQTPEAPAPDPTWKNTTLTGLEVLVAEDNPVNQMVIQRLLERTGLSVRMTSDGEACQRAYHERRPDLILMDCQMPICDGYQATMALRAAGATLPIIALTANTMPGDKAKCLAAGMSDHVGKPIEINELMACIESWRGVRAVA